MAAGDLLADGGAGLVGPGGLDQLGAQVQVPGVGDVPARVRSPLEYSLGVNPQNPMNAPAVANRRQSHTSLARVSAPRWVIPR